MHDVCMMIFTQGTGGIATAHMASPHDTYFYSFWVEFVQLDNYSTSTYKHMFTAPVQAVKLIAIAS